jgi:hypothetical protein
MSAMVNIVKLIPIPMSVMVNAVKMIVTAMDNLDRYLASLSALVSEDPI